MRNPVPLYLRKIPTNFSENQLQGPELILNHRAAAAAVITAAAPIPAAAAELTVAEEEISDFVRKGILQETADQKIKIPL